jgi:hypothetical protein
MVLEYGSPGVQRGNLDAPQRAVETGLGYMGLDLRLKLFNRTGGVRPLGERTPTPETQGESQGWDAHGARS